MARFNPLTGTIEVSAPPAPKARSRKPVGEDRPAPTPKIAAHVPRNAAAAADAAASVLPLTAAARHAARLPVATYAALLGGGDAAAARTTRDAFIAWCNARPEHADWRAAWTLYSAPAPVAAVAPPAPWYMTSTELMFVCEICHCSNHVTTDGLHLCTSCQAGNLTRRADTRYGLEVTPYAETPAATPAPAIARWPFAIDLAGRRFRSAEHGCIWTVRSYTRNGNWRCEEPDHHTTCDFHDSVILAGEIAARVPRSSVIMAAL